MLLGCKNIKVNFVDYTQVWGLLSTRPPKQESKLVFWRGKRKSPCTARLKELEAEKYPYYYDKEKLSSPEPFPL